MRLILYKIIYLKRVLVIHYRYHLLILKLIGTLSVRAAYKLALVHRCKFY